MRRMFIQHQINPFVNVRQCSIVLACAQGRPPKTSLKVYKMQELVLRGKKVDSSRVEYNRISCLQYVKKQPLASLRGKFCSSTSEKLFGG